MSTDGYFDLHASLTPVWQGGTITNESLLFTPDPATGQTRPCRLLCPPEQILRVCSGDLQTEYAAGRDFRMEGDCMVRLPGSRMPQFSFDEYLLRSPASVPVASVSCPGRYVRYEPDGVETIRRQIAVSYTHSSPCPVPCPASMLSRLPQTARRLRKKQPLALLFYGDSFLAGCDASGRTGIAPYLPPLDWLTVLALSDAYDHSKIHRMNTAVGGTTSRWGVEQAEERLAALAPDLAVIRFGMNDSGVGIPTEEYARNIGRIMEIGRRANPKMEFLLLSSETPNPDCQGWTRLQRAYEPVLRLLAEQTEGCGFVSLATLFDAAVSRKGYPSLSANFINHPNDFMIRIYAMAITQALLDAGKIIV